MSTGEVSTFAGVLRLSANLLKFNIMKKDNKSQYEAPLMMQSQLACTGNKVLCASGSGTEQYQSMDYNPWEA